VEVGFGGEQFRGVVFHVSNGVEVLEVVEEVLDEVGDRRFEVGAHVVVDLGAVVQREALLGDAQ